MNEQKKFVVETKLSAIDYLALVESIALEFFNIEGEYTPHIGELNAMRLFWNICVKDSPYEDLGHDISKLEDFETILADGDFFREFFDEIECRDYVYKGIDFGKAYETAMLIVDHKKSSLTTVVDYLKTALAQLTEKFGGVVSAENLEALNKIAEDISNGNLSADAIVNAYGKTLKKKK